MGSDSTSVSCMNWNAALVASRSDRGRCQSKRSVLLFFVLEKSNFLQQEHKGSRVGRWPRNLVAVDLQKEFFNERPLFRVFQFFERKISPAGPILP